MEAALALMLSFLFALKKENGFQTLLSTHVNSQKVCKKYDQHAGPRVVDINERGN